jgi:hypothetical protein
MREASRAGSRLASPWKVGGTARDAGDAGGVGAWAYILARRRPRKERRDSVRTEGLGKSMTMIMAVA